MKRLFLALVLSLFCATTHAAVGDMVVVGGHGVLTTATVTIQPSAGVEWLITTCAGSDLWQLQYAYDGTNFVAIDSYAAGSVHGLQWRLTNSQAMKIKNNSGNTADVVCQGVVTK